MQKETWTKKIQKEKKIKDVPRRARSAKRTGKAPRSALRTGEAEGTPSVKIAPRGHDMLNNCFLGPNKSFPICAKQSKNRKVYIKIIRKAEDILKQKGLSTG